MTNHGYILANGLIATLVIALVVCIGYIVYGAAEYLYYEKQMLGQVILGLMALFIMIYVLGRLMIRYGYDI